jgi:HSP20 family protein
MTTNKEISVNNMSTGAVTRPDVREDEYTLPLADIFETPDAYVLMLDMPGAQKENIRVRLESGSLSVSAPALRHFREDAAVLHEETRVHGYMRAFSLGEGIDLKNVDAQFEDGVLTIKLVKNEELKPREISIR